ncbi:MAG TPA: CBS domain-containing protein [Kofleriaceae bacterium]|jgi:CBS domain-containing membrane protein|nr:CBS domain-containing protein [Kofleriaceae bacterium]
MPTRVRDLMTTKLVTLFAEQAMPLAEEIMRFRHIRHLPVVEPSGKLVGLVSHRDILAANTSSLVGLSDEQRRARQGSVLVKDIMTKDMWTVTPQTYAEVAAQTLLDHAYGCLPVVEDGKLVGILTERDFLKVAILHLRANNA